MIDFSTELLNNTVEYDVIICHLKKNGNDTLASANLEISSTALTRFVTRTDWNILELMEWLRGFVTNLPKCRRIPRTAFSFFIDVPRISKSYSQQESLRFIKILYDFLIYNHFILMCFTNAVPSKSTKYFSSILTELAILISYSGNTNMW